MDDIAKLKALEEKLKKYRNILDEKRKKFRGVKHESSLSELRYTEFMVYQGIVGDLEKEIARIKGILKLGQK